MMFVRFVVGSDSENAAWLNGVLTEARILRDAGALPRHEAELLNQTFDWFNEHLPVPPFRKKFRSGDWTRDAVCWFHPNAKEPIERVWDLVAILRENGVPVRVVKSRKPGGIVYEDAYQVVAETPYWA